MIKAMRIGHWFLPVILGLAGTSMLILVSEFHPHLASLAYLVGFAFALSIALGGMLMGMICDASSAVWFVIVRRHAEACAAALLPLALLMIPILLLLPLIYPWAAVAPPADLEALIVHRHAYLNPFAFSLRVALYLCIWVACAEILRQLSLRQDRMPQAHYAPWRRRISGIGLLPLLMSITWAAIDWYMSIDVHWSSSITGLYHITGDGLAGMAMITILGATAESASSPSPGVEHRHAMGKLLFACSVTWSYIALAQILIIWMGDLPPEAQWYLQHTQGFPGILLIAVAVLQGAIPLFFLMSRPAKRDGVRLVTVSISVLVGHYLDLVWVIMPPLQDGAALIGIALLGGLCCVSGVSWLVAAWRQRFISSIPTGDPDLSASLNYQSDP